MLCQRLKIDQIHAVLCIEDEIHQMTPKGCCYVFGDVEDGKRTTHTFGS